jgi:RimJ/RimL family protein N-acetyltransferase
MEHPFLAGKLVHLRPLGLDDVDPCLRWISDAEVTDQLLIGRFPFNRLQEEEWVRGLYKSTDAVHFGIARAADGALIGGCALHDIHPVDRFAVLGIFVGEKGLWGRGYGTEATRLLVDYGLRTLNLNRIELTVFEYNERALRSYTKLGFVQEGRLRAKRFKRGRYWDEIVMAVLAQDWNAPAEPPGAP